MAEIKERLAIANEQFNSGLFAATAAKGVDGVISPINPDPSDKRCE